MSTRAAEIQARMERLEALHASSVDIGGSVREMTEFAKQSKDARQILDHWTESRARFIKVFPHEYQRALKQMNANAAASATIAKARAEAVTAK